MTRLLRATVKLYIDVRDADDIIDEKQEIEIAINQACSMLEKSTMRDPKGSVSYRLEVQEI